MTTGDAYPNHATPAGRDTFIIHSNFMPLLDTFVLDILFIVVREFLVGLPIEFLLRYP